MIYRDPTAEEKQLLIEIACYFSERAVCDPDEKLACEHIAEIIGKWKPEMTSDPRDSDANGPMC
jgi:hypothetical protein